ncbi:MAG TPA: DUF1553 domain-containing protein [Planctomycetota bacterium]|nr:DUF1553 domain-containing protein [Planctomycetota bacterium]
MRRRGRCSALGRGMLVPGLASWLAAQAPAPCDPVPDPAVGAGSAAAPTLCVHPAAIHLDDGLDVQRVTALERTASGATVDRTGAVQWQVVGADLAEISHEGETIVLRGLRNGDGTLIARSPEGEVRVPLQVRHVEVQPEVSFRNQVIPILTRAGCNTGACHGAAVGKEGFALSLFGYDPDHDHLTLTRDLKSRRVDPAAPEQSLMLQKATGAVPHKGNKRFAVDSPAYRSLRAWIDAGAPDDKERAPALLGIEVLPATAVLVGPGQELPLQVLAHYGNGDDRDVTALALWSSSNDGAAAVANDGRATSHEAGETCVLARFGGFATAAQVLVLDSDRPFVWPDVPAANFVDRRIHEKLQRARVAPAERCSDQVFVRRVFLDLLSTLPSPDETRSFVADPAADKRARLVDALLRRPEFALLQAMLWAEVLQVDAETMEPKGAALLTRWLQQGFADGRPFDAMVKDLLTAEGPTFETAEANFYLAASEPHLLGERVAQNFLGVRLQCAQCHNHPFENWTMDDYYGFAAFFAQVGRKRSEDPYEWVIWDRRNGVVRNKRDNTVAEPRFLGGGAAQIPAGTDRRQVLADWLCAADNAFFARSVVNRVWARLFGRGLVDPPDDVRVSNPASHPQLLTELAALFTSSHFDVREVYRCICASRTYQLARHTGDPSPALFAGNQARRLSAEQLLDAIGAVTGVPTKYPGVPLGEPATAIARGRTGVRFLDTFGRPPRETSCTCERRAEPTLGQTLHLINGDTIAQKIADKNGRLQRLLAAAVAPGAMLDELFLAAYSRTPGDTERARLLAGIAAAGDAATAWQDLFWAVLNSQEFGFQH